MVITSGTSEDDATGEGESVADACQRGIRSVIPFLTICSNKGCCFYIRLKSERCRRHLQHSTYSGSQTRATWIVSLNIVNLCHSELLETF